MKRNNRDLPGYLHCLTKCCIGGIILFLLAAELFLRLNTESPKVRISINNRNTEVNISNLNITVNTRNLNSTTNAGNLDTTVNISNLNATKSNYTNEQFIKWNQSLCSHQSTLRGPHQKIIGISIYGLTSNFSNNPIFSWNGSILLYLESLTDEVKLLLPSWIIRLYIDFTGSTKTQRDRLYSFSNVDICDMKDIPLFGSSIFTYLPGKFWRFLPIFDPYVDYYLSRDLDSPMTQREVDTIDEWLRNESKTKFFYIARDNKLHDIAILGGLWGAATLYARKVLFSIFEPILVPSIVSRYIGAGDQDYLQEFVWPRVANNSLAFDSYTCARYGGRPFLTQRQERHCFLGCIRPCCTNATNYVPPNLAEICPLACRPKHHQDWIYC